MAKIEESMPYLLKNEGGFVNDPVDRAGATKYGITQRTLAAFRSRPVSVEDVRSLTIEEATRIYKTQYWDTLNLDKVTSQFVATAIFDVGVLRGPRVAARLAQAALVKLGYTMSVDGEIGVYTLSALNRCDAVKWLEAFQALDEEGYYRIVEKNPSQRKFLRGWLNRARRLLGLKPKTPRRPTV